MNPTGLTFALFLPVVLVLYWLVPRRAGAQNAVLLAASYVFYLSWSPEWLPLLLLATAIDWLAGRLLDDGRLGQRQRSAVLLVSLISNIGALAWFKYRGFFAASFVALLESAGVSVSLPVISVVLPIGLSYYTLIKIGYVVDVYFGRVPACRSPLTFATFVAFFPQLLAGPITRAGQMLPQLAAPRAPTTAMCSRAASALLLGWFMKGYVADWIAPAVVDPVFATAGVAGAFSHWLALLGYAVQVFCDFAGYSLLAIGIGRLFGVELPPNFDRPFLSRSMPRVVEALAHQPQYLALRLSLRPHGDRARRAARSHRDEPRARLRAVRTLAWSAVDLRTLGRPARPRAGRTPLVGRLVPGKVPRRPPLGHCAPIAPLRSRGMGPRPGVVPGLAHPVSGA